MVTKANRNFEAGFFFCIVENKNVGFVNLLYEMTAIAIATYNSLYDIKA